MGGRTSRVQSQTGAESETLSQKQNKNKRVGGVYSSSGRYSACLVKMSIHSTEGRETGRERERTERKKKRKKKDRARSLLVMGYGQSCSVWQ
jgi:hypothetical protein